MSRPVGWLPMGTWVRIARPETATEKHLVKIHPDDVYQIVGDWLGAMTLVSDPFGTKVWLRRSCLDTCDYQGKNSA